MREIPECLNRRYRALDELIRELSSAMTPRASVTESLAECASETDNAGIRLMCDFWNILKENPDCDLPLEVQQRMNLVPKQSRIFRPQHITCYMAGKSSSSDTDDKKKKSKSSCCQSRTPPEPKQKSSCCASKSVTPTGSEAMPLSKVLCNLKEAASFEKKCTAKVSKLMETQKELQCQIQVLEDREKEGVQLLKQADCMWSCMEDSYKTKVAESLERQKILVKQMKEVEASATKWRKNKKDLEFQLTNVSKCHEEIKEKLGQKTNDIKIMDMEIDDFKKRLLFVKNDIENSKNSLKQKRTSCDAKVARVMEDISRLQKELADEGRRKSDKEKEGNGYVKEAREDLQKMCKVLLRKKLENEDLLAEKDALLEEIDILKQTCDQCKGKCAIKQTTILNEIKKIEGEIADHKVRCIRCHQCTDTTDVRKLCTDCPRCKEERECLYEDDHCSPDHTMDCVCISIKQKFLDNVFDNMYTVLERQARTGPGKAVAEAVLNCLKRSRNGKLDNETKKILQEFILTTVKKNLNLTIVGGAVKTRCEMDAETYKQLMLCLKQVKTTPPPKEDKGTPVKKDPCYRWGGTSECNCPKGPKGCICTKKAPPPPHDPTPCPPPDKEDTAAGQSTACPYKDNAACGTDCAMRDIPSAVGTDVAAWRPDPCKGQSCPFSKNMRAAQCMLGPESLSSLPKGRATAPYVPDVSALENTFMCNCGSAPAKQCACREDRRCRPRQRIIEEVMGRYTEVSPIEKVFPVDEYTLTEMTSNRRQDKYCERTPWIATYSSKTMMDRSCSCASDYELTKNRKDLIKINRKGQISICKNVKDSISLGGVIKDKNPPPLPKKGSLGEINFKNVLKNDTNVEMILCPKFIPCFNKSEQTIAPSTTIVNSFSRPKFYCIRNEQCSLDSYDASYVGRKVCNTVRELMKCIVKPDAEIKNISAAPNSVWITVESLCKEIEHLTKSERPSEITLNEIEMSCEVLDASKDMTNNKMANKIHVCDKIRSNNILITKVPIEEPFENYKEKIFFDVSEDNIKAEINRSGISVNKLLSKQLNNPQSTKFVDTMSKGCAVHSKDFNNSNKNVNKCLRYSAKSENQKDSCNSAKSEKDKHIYYILNEATEYLQCNKTNLDNAVNKNKLEIKESNTYFKALSEMHRGALQRNKNSTINSDRTKVALNLSKNKYKNQKRNTKHLKAEVMKHFDKGTYINSHIDTVKCRASHIGTIIPDFDKDLAISFEKSKTKQDEKIKNESYQNTAIETQANYKDGSSEAINKINIKQESYPEKIKIQLAVGSKHGEKDIQFTELIKTLSGTLAMELDERVVEDIEKKIKEDPYSFLAFKETDIGHNLIYFDTKNEASDNQRVVMRKTSSGNTVFEIRKSIIRILNPDDVKEQNKTRLELKSPSKNIAKSSKSAYTDLLLSNIRLKYNNNTTSIDSINSKLMNEIDYQTKLNQLYETGSRSIDIKVVKGNAVSETEKASIIKMPTGNIAVNFKNISLPDFHLSKKIPVLLNKSNSGTYLIDTSSTQAPNAVLETTLSESILLKVTERANITRPEHSNEFFKVKVKGSSIDMTELPAVLKTSDSDNYIIVLDKEFEKRYKQTIQDYIGDKTECYVDLNKSDSGSFVIKLYDTEDASVENANALLVKTPSGSIKVYVKGAIFDIMHKLPTKKSSICSAKAFGVLLNKLPPSSREFHREKLRKSKFLESKSSSESNIYNNSNRHDKDLFCKSTLELKKTDSGKYAVVLNKESKKRFINNLKSYLAINSQGLIPINRTESGEITIVLNNNNHNNELYGSLKITPSGNIYVLVDENVIKEIVKKDAIKTGSSCSDETGSSYVIGAIKTTVNKAVATTCNARPDDCSCDASKCVCKELLSDTTEWLKRPKTHEHVVLPLLQNKNVNWFDVKNNAYLEDQNKYKMDTCGETPTLNVYGIPKESHHVNIKPSYPSPTLENKLGSTEQCYVLDTVCPYHKDRFSPGSNEILDISGCCNRGQENISPNNEFGGTAEVRGARGREMDDSLDFLPPQLPSFLSNVYYR